MKTAIVITMIGDSFVAFMNSRKEWDVLEVCFEANETPIYSDFNNFIKDYAVYTNSKSVFYIGDYTYKRISVPIYLCFVKNIKREWLPKTPAALDRKIISHKKIFNSYEERISLRLKELALKAREFLDSSNPSWNFSFIKSAELNEKSAPVTQVMAFCKNSKNEFCIVRDKDESFYSLPGGGCELDELPEDGIRREVMEEAQFEIQNLQILGAVMVDMKLNGVSVSKSQHLRYLCDVKDESIKAFIAGRDGHETTERKFVEKSELANLVKLLKNPTGIEILKSFD